MREDLAAEYVRRVVSEALEEDGARDDATLAFLRLAGDPVRAEIVVDEEAVVAGLEFAKECFAQMDASVAFEAHVEDGDRAKAGDVVCRLDGRSTAILAAERVALNFLQRLSGIATLTARFVKKVEGAGITILDTRKTTPMWRDAEKYAVRCGGGQNHRRDLRSMVLIKENHIRSLGGQRALVEFLRARPADASEAPFVEVEVDSLTFLEEMMAVPVDRVMLDNFTPAQVRDGLALIGRSVGKGKDAAFEIEVSGGITLDNIDRFAIEGVDYISIGALTHSAPAVSMSLEVS